MASTETGPPGPGPPGPPSRPYEAGAPARSARGWQRQLGLQLSRPWARWPLTGLAWAAALALIGFMSFTALASTGHQLLADLHVYRTGGQSVLAGRPLYGALTNGKLLFTYPPVSAVLAVPLAWVPWRAAQFLWLPMIYVPLAVVIGLSFRPLLARARRWAPAAFAGLLAGCVLLAPIRQVIHFGQVDIFLVALCAVDCLARRAWWPRGALIGLATAIKLVPGVFIVYLLITGRRKAAAVAGLAFAAWTGLAWLISPANSAAYWTSAIFSSNRLGPNAPTANQSLRGILLRAFFPGPPPTLLWLGLGLAVAVAGFAAARQSWRLGSAVGGAAITGLLAALLSPVAWVHHYCWIILALGAIAGNGRRNWRVIVALAAGGLFTTALPVFGGYLYFGHVIPALPALVLADAFGLAALALIWVIYCSARSDRSDAERAPPPAPADPDKEEVTPSVRILVSRPAPPSG